MSENETESCAQCEEHIDPGDESIFVPGVHVTCTSECDRCGVIRASEDLIDTDDGSTCCQGCTRCCDGCSGAFNRRRLYSTDGGWYCTNCTGSCSACGDRHSTENLPWVEDVNDHVCEECSGYCDNCEERTTNTDDNGDWCCADCAQGSDIEGYHHTSPSMWLGGPVRSRGGYYLGIELEISADRPYRGTPIKEWAEANMGSRDGLHCKEDSSVEGFEIVSEPMTPEFFEALDWDGFMALINRTYPQQGEEPREHGLHVHIGRQAFARRRKDGSWSVDHPSVAAFSYLLAQGDHLERIGRRSAYHYCEKVAKPVSTAIVRRGQETYGVYSRQRNRIESSRNGVYPERSAINLLNSSTVEIRAFRSTRVADDLRDAVRLVYVAAEYVRYLRNRPEGFGSTKLRWDEFAAWVAVEYPFAYRSISGTNRVPTQVVTTVVNYSEVDPDVVRAERDARRAREEQERAEYERQEAEREAARQAERQARQARAEQRANGYAVAWNEARSSTLPRDARGRFVSQVATYIVDSAAEPTAWGWISSDAPAERAAYAVLPNGAVRLDGVDYSPETMNNMRMCGCTACVDRGRRIQVLLDDANAADLL